MLFAVQKVRQASWIIRCRHFLLISISDTDLRLMRRIDELHLDYPLAGNRMLRGLLLVEGYKVRRLHVRTLMKRMGIEAIYRRSNTSKPAPGHKIYPYLLSKLPVIRSNQVSLTGMKRTLPGNGAMGITYIPIKRGFVYLAAVIDWLIRRFYRGGFPLTWRQASALNLLRRRLPGMESQIYLILIRAHSSPLFRLPRF